MSNEITVLERAVLAVGDLKGAFFALADKAKSICSCETKDEFAEVKAIYKELKDARVEADKRGKEVRDDAVKFQKGVISYVSELAQITASEETRLKALIDAFEESERQRIAYAKQVKIDRANRLSEICQSFVVIPAFDGTSELFLEKISELESVDVAALDLAEYAPLATSNIAVSVMALTNAIAACKQRESQAAEQARLLQEANERAAIAEAKAKAEREEQKRLTNERAEESKRLAKIERDIQAEKDAVARKLQEEADLKASQELAEAKKQAAEAKAALDKIEQEKRDKLAEEQAESERIANERAAIAAAELARTETENQARIEREQSEVELKRREANKPDAENFRLFCEEVLMMISRKETFIAANRAAYERLADAIVTVRCDAIIEMIGE